MSVIFITLMAYHLVHTLRVQLKEQGIEDGTTFHIRKATRAEPLQKEIYDALTISAQPGAIQKTLA